MAILQVKRVPDDLYEKAKARAASQGITLSEYVLRTMQRDLSLPTMDEWLDEVQREPVRVSGEVDIQWLMDQVRDEIDDG